MLYNKFKYYMNSYDKIVYMDLENHNNDKNIISIIISFIKKVFKISKNNYEVHGCYKVMKDKLHITEIPVGITKFKENLEKKLDLS